MRAIKALKGGVDKVTKDLSEVVLITANLKNKKFDTTAMIQWVNEQKKIVDNQRDEIYQKWVTLKQEDHAILGEAELKGKTKEALAAVKLILDIFKIFAKDVLGEFRNN